MDDLISRQAAIDAIKDIDTRIIPWAKAKEYADEGLRIAIEKIEKLPDAEKETDVKDISVDNWGTSGFCGKCFELVLGDWEFCPRCGKKLRWG